MKDEIPLKELRRIMKEKSRPESEVPLKHRLRSWGKDKEEGSSSRTESVSADVESDRLTN